MPVPGEHTENDFKWTDWALLALVGAVVYTVAYVLSAVLCLIFWHSNAVFQGLIAALAAVWVVFLGFTKPPIDYEVRSKVEDAKKRKNN